MFSLFGVCSKPVSSILQLHFSNMENFASQYEFALLSNAAAAFVDIVVGAHVFTKTGSNCFLFIVWICKLTILWR